jgi:hypothetical protein
VRRADNLTTFMCRLSRNLLTSTSCNPKGLSRPVMGLLYLVYTDTVCNLRRRTGALAKNTNQLMLYRGNIIAYFEDHRSI